MTRRRVLVATCAAIVCLAAASLAVHGTRWRARLVALKVAGQLPDLSWGELARNFAPKSAVTLEPLLANHNPYQALRNRFTTAADVAAGRTLFARNCAECHGSDARGRSGPDLTTGVFPHGASDWGLFRTISQGVPGTAMPPHQSDPASTWQLVAYVRAAVNKSMVSQGIARRGDPAVPPLPTPFDVTFDRIREAETNWTEWPTYSGSLSGRRHSALAQITRQNVAQLRVRWLFQFPKHESVVEGTPLVVGNTMFVSLPPNIVWALDARTGEVLWTFASPAPPANDLRVTYMVHRGLAILGNTLFVATSDAHLIAVDAQTGSLQWDAAVGDYRQGYSMTSPPLAIEGKVIVGVAGGERGIRGFIDAYSAATGKRLWQFNTIPGPGEPGHDSWAGDSWKKGGAPTWLTGSYDPDLDLVYWGVGNPGPDFNGEGRLGDNLYSNSVVALDGTTGALRWHFQFTPHDEHDRDATQIPVLADAMFRGRPRQLLYWANRNGFYYVLDRVTGEYLHASQFAKQSWASGLDSAGRPIGLAAARPSRAGTLAFPSVDGATNWWSPSLDSAANLFFVPTMEGGTLFFSGDPEQDPSTGVYIASHTSYEFGVPAWTAIRALDASTGERRWEYRFPPRSRSIVMGGLLSSDGGLVFGGDMNRFVALDASTGKELWHFNTGGPIAAAPITYQSEGRQNVAIMVGGSVLVFSLGGK